MWSAATWRRFDDAKSGARSCTLHGSQPPQTMRSLDFSRGTSGERRGVEIRSTLQWSGSARRPDSAVRMFGVALDATSRPPAAGWSASGGKVCRWVAGGKRSAAPGTGPKMNQSATRAKCGWNISNRSLRAQIFFPSLTPGGAAPRTRVRLRRTRCRASLPGATHRSAHSGWLPVPASRTLRE